MIENPSSPRPDHFEIVRFFDAPRTAVWRAWTEPELMMRWYGPKDFTAPYVKIDLRVGGKYLNCMKSPEGKEFWGTGTYRIIDPPKRLIMTDSFADKDGNVVPATYYGMSASFPLEMPVELILEDLNGKTKMTLRYPDTTGLSESDRKGMIQGWNESFDKLEEAVKKAAVVAGQTV